MGEGSNLRVRLLGTWQLVSAVIRFEDGELRNRFGDDAYGFLIYSADGYVSAVLGARDRAAIASDVPRRKRPMPSPLARKCDSWLRAVHCGRREKRREALDRGESISELARTRGDACGGVCWRATCVDDGFAAIAGWEDVQGGSDLEKARMKT